jgi:hypothetical protein
VFTEALPRNALSTYDNIIRVIKSRRMRWTGCVTNMEEVRNAHIILVRNQILEDLGLGGWAVID